MARERSIPELAHEAVTIAGELNTALTQLIRHIQVAHPDHGCCALVLNEHLPEFKEKENG